MTIQPCGCGLRIGTPESRPCAVIVRARYLVGARSKEDAPLVPVEVNRAGDLRHLTAGELPATSSRRHSIALAGWCELCGHEVAVTFAQHKGQTLVEVHRRRQDSDEAWTVVER